MTTGVQTKVWYTYHFETGLDCPLGCGPGAHPLYEGMSCQPWVRVLQHAQSQPWWGHQTGYQVHPEAYATKADAEAAEQTRIGGRLPLANIRHNEDNPHRWDFGAGRAPSRRPVVVRRRRRVRRRPVWQRLPLPRTRRRGKTMIRRIVEFTLIGLVIWYVVHNPAGTADALKSIAGGIGDFVTHLAS